MRLSMQELPSSTAVCKLTMASSPVGHIPAGVRALFQPPLVASAPDLVQPHWLAKALSKVRVWDSGADGAFAQLQQGSSQCYCAGMGGSGCKALPHYASANPPAGKLWMQRHW